MQELDYHNQQPEININNGSRFKFITKQGMEMKPLLSSGDVLKCDTSFNKITQDAVYALIIKDQLFIRNIQRDPRNKQYLLCCENPTYDTMPMSFNDEFEVLGKITDVMKINRV